MTNKFKLTHQHYIFFIIIILTLFILSAYWPVQKFEFTNYDDQLYITENYHIQSGLNFKSTVAAFQDVHYGHWHPLTMMSHVLDWRLFGDKAGGHHWTNVIIHIFNTILLFLLFNSLTGALWRSAFVAAVFAIHPLNVESVAWISERKNVLSTFFLIVTIFFYAFYVKKPNWKRYLLVFLFFALGLMSKPMLITLPFVLLLLDYWPLYRLQIDPQSNEPINIKWFVRINGKIIFKLISEKVPLFILSAISIYFTIYAARNVGTLSNLETLSFHKRFFNAIVSYSLYIKKMFWPTDLAVFYPLSDIPTWQLFIYLVFFVSVTIFVCRFFRKYPYLLVGWFWYLGTLVPVIGLVQVGSQAMADRYAYVPLIGIFIMIAWGTSYVLSKIFYRKIIITLSTAVLIVLFVLTNIQINYWKDTTALFEHALNVTKNNYMAYTCLGNELLKKNEIDGAIQYYYTSLKLYPKNDSALVGFAWALHLKGKNDKAITMIRLALQLNPKSADAHNRLGVILFNEGYLDEAIIEYQKAIDLNNENYLFHNNLANALIEKRRIKEGIKK